MTFAPARSTPSTFTRGDDGRWQLGTDTLENPRDKNTLSKPLVGTIRPVE